MSPRVHWGAQRARRWTRIGLALIALLVLLVLGRWAANVIPTFAAWVDGLGTWGPVAFVLGYAIACVVFVPALLLTLAAGALFGFWLGLGVVLGGATLGAVASFCIARYLARDAVERRLSRTPRLAALDRMVGSHGRRIVLLMRLSPVFPFGVLNYALGVTQLRFADFLIAMVGIVPGTTLYVYSGSVAGTLATAASGNAPVRGLAYYAVLGVGLIATLVVTVVITRAARRALKAAGATRDDVGAASTPQASPNQNLPTVHGV